VRLPAQLLDGLTEGGEPLTVGNDTLSASVAGGAAVIEVDCGRYDFIATGLNPSQAMADVRHVAGRLNGRCTERGLLANEATSTVLAYHLGAVLPQTQDLDCGHWTCCCRK